MKREIGSNFWEYKLDKENTSSYMPNIDCHNSYYFMSGRLAIYTLIKQLNCDNKTVLLPYFTCESVIEPFIKAKCNVIFYGIDNNLKVNPDEIRELADKYNPKMILFHSYYGFNTNDKLNEKLIPYLKNRNIFVVEDLTQDYFSSFKKLNADYYVASLRKFYAIPNGGIIISPNKKLNIKYDSHKILHETDKLALEAFNLKKEYMRSKYANVDKQTFLDKYAKLQEYIENMDYTLPISDTSLKIYNNIIPQKIKTIRRKNFKYLLKEISKIHGIELIFKKLPKDTVPLYFPLYLKMDRTIFQKKMAKNNIFCPIIWPKSKYVNYKCDNKLYKNLICIPCDQRYTIKDIERICITIKKILQED